LACRDLGNGSEPVIVIFCFGGAGISFEEDASESSEPASESESDSGSGSGLDLDLVDFEVDLVGWEVWNKLSDEGRVSGSVARSFPFPFDFLDVDAFV
jgi:hypothetical protein